MLLALSIAASFAATLPAARAETSITAVQGRAARPTIVLVHGAFADSGSWNGVTKALSAKGYPVRSIANPLRSVAGDARYAADRNIPLQALRFMAERAQAKDIVEVKGASQVVMVSHPEAVAKLIEEAAGSR